MRRALVALFLVSLSASSLAVAPQGAKLTTKSAVAALPSGALRTYGARLEGFDYPFPVHIFRATAEGRPVEMAYMELAPQKPNGRTLVLLHGKNFCGATWGALRVCWRQPAIG